VKGLFGLRLGSLKLEASSSACLERRLLLPTATFQRAYGLADNVVGRPPTYRIVSIHLHGDLDGDEAAKGRVYPRGWLAYTELGCVIEHVYRTPWRTACYRGEDLSEET
jgi:hypothetical protein